MQDGLQVLRHLVALSVIVLIAGSARAVAPLERVESFEKLHTGDPPSVMRLYLMPTAPAKLDWGSPRRLLLSTLKATLLNPDHPIGHVNIEVQYRGQEDAAHHLFTGATDQESGASRRLLLKDGLAFSILERSWPGRLEGDQESSAAIANRCKRRNRLAVVTFIISDATCQRLLDYVHALRTDSTPRYYGFSARPRRGEGSGCSAFGASFVELIGVMDPALRGAWGRTVRVPLSLMAGYLGRPSIGVTRAALSPAAAAWAAPEDPHMLLECYDPDRMFDWAVHSNVAPGEIAGLPVQPDPAFPKELDRRYDLGGRAERNVRAVIVDAREVPTPAEPIFSGPQDLILMEGTHMPTVIRGGKVVSPNGSFEMRP